MLTNLFNRTTNAHRALRVKIRIKEKKHEQDYATVTHLTARPRRVRL